MALVGGGVCWRGWAGLGDDVMNMTQKLFVAAMLAFGAMSFTAAAVFVYGLIKLASKL